MCTQGNNNVSPKSRQSPRISTEAPGLRRQGIRREGLGARGWQLAVTQDAEAVPRLKGQRKRHCSMRLKPTDRRPANRLALALHTRSYCEICLLHSQIYSSRQYTRPLLLLTPSFTYLPFDLLMFGVAARNRALFATTASSRNALTRPVAAYRGSFVKGVCRQFSSSSRRLHSFFPSILECCSVARGPDADIPNHTVCNHHGRPTEEEAEQSARW